MPNASQSSVQAAIAAIIERQQREGKVPPEDISQANQAWIDRNLSKHLEPVLEPIFAELARKIGLDKNKLDEAVARHEQEVTQYLKEREAETEKKLAALTKIYREGLANRKAALEKVVAKPPAHLWAIDKPVSIFGQPSGFLVDDHIESWNSWAKVVASMDSDHEDRSSLIINFFFSWLNDSDDSVIITGAQSSITARGKCFLHVDPSLAIEADAKIWLTSGFTIYLGPTLIEGVGNPIATFGAHALPKWLGGTTHTDFHAVFGTAPPILCTRGPRGRPSAGHICSAVPGFLPNSQRQR
jgi:hypothetical protein